MGQRRHVTGDYKTKTQESRTEKQQKFYVKICEK